MDKNLKKGLSAEGNQGFTLIELLVVIAIIGVLAAVVLSATNSARDKAANATIKANLANARAQADLFYEANTNRYKFSVAAVTRDVCDSSASVTANGTTFKGIYQNVYTAALAAGLADPVVKLNMNQTSATANCNSTTVSNPAGTTWVAQVPLKSGDYYCVDHTGASKVEILPLLSTATACL